MSEFQRWYQRLINSAITSKMDLDKHPLGSCCQRDVLRDKRVKEVLKTVWEEIFLD